MTRRVRRKIGDLTAVLSGFAFDSSFFKDEGELPLVRIRDVVVGESATFYDGAFDKRYLVSDGDVLIGMDGEFNRARWRGGRALLNQRVCKINSISSDLCDRYLYWFLPGALKAIEQVTPFVTVKHLSVKQIRDIDILLPPLPEQRRIAEILDKADALRAKRRAAIAQVDTLTQSIFLDMFGDPATNPKEWLETTLGEAAEIVTGFPFSSEEYMTGEDSVRLCRGANVLPGRIDWSDLARWPRQKADDVASFLLAEGDVVIAMDRPWISEGFKIAQVEKYDCPSLLVQRVARIRAMNGVENAFLYHLLRKPPFTRHCRPTETTIPHISPRDIRSYKFPLPPHNLQRDFVQRVRLVDQIRHANVRSRQEFDALFASIQKTIFNMEK